MKDRNISRRSMLKAGAATGAALFMPALLSKRALSAEPIKVGLLTDLSGPVGGAGQSAKAGFDLAIEELNAAGGVLGRELQVTGYDAESDLQLYTRFAQQLVLSDEVNVVFGGVTSASREAIRPVFHHSETLYFYPVPYEGGVCDRNSFCFGATPAHTVGKMVPHVIKQWGKKIYVIGADYNYGHIIAKWFAKFAKDAGGEVIATEFLPLDVTNFSSTIAKIQAAAPDLVLDSLAGSNHLGFYRQWEAAGMKSRIPNASASFGSSSELPHLDASTTDGIVSCLAYYATIDNPKNRAFVEAVTPRLPAGVEVNELASDHYEAVHAWALAVTKAGGIERDAVVTALESGLSIEGPSGKVVIDPQTHHTVRNAYLGQAADKAWKVLEVFPDQRPADTAAVCDLAATPDSNKQFEITAD